MNRWQAELFDRLLELNTEPQVADRIGQAATELGFHYYTYGLWLPLPLSSPALEFCSNAPQEWQQRYRRMGYVQHDPVLLHARRSREPLVWTDEVFGACPQLQADARKHGLHAGWTQSSFNAQGMLGVLTLTYAGAASDRSPTRAQPSHEADLRWLAYMAHLFLSNVIVKRCKQQTSVELTSREAEVLRWTGDGKTTGEISSILNISDNTVNYHVKNAMTKLHAVNKTSAVVMALTRGLLAEVPTGFRFPGADG